MSIARTWSGRVAARSLSRQGWISCPGAGVDVFGRRCIAATPIRFVGVATWHRPTSRPSFQQAFQPPAARDRILQVQLTGPTQ